MSSLNFPLGGDVVRFSAGHSLSRQVVGLPLTAHIERVNYVMFGTACYNDTVEFTDGTWLSYQPTYGWRYFHPTGPLLGLPVLVDEKGLAQPGYWRRFLDERMAAIAAREIGRRAATLVLCAGLALATSCTTAARQTAEQRAERPRPEMPTPDTTYFHTLKR